MDVLWDGLLKILRVFDVQNALWWAYSHQIPNLPQSTILNNKFLHSRKVENGPILQNSWKKKEHKFKYKLYEKIQINMYLDL